MPGKRRTVNGLHGDRLKQIRKFVNFDYDLRQPLTNTQKRKIKKYHDEIRALTNRPYQVYRARNADHLNEAQLWANNGRNLPGIKVAFIPTDGKNRVRLSFTNKGVVAATKHVRTHKVSLSIAGLLRDPVAHVNSRIAGHVAKQFTIRADVYEIPQPYLPETVAKAVARLVAKYGESNGLTDDDNHYFGHWLHGLNAYTFDSQNGLQEYLIEKQKAIAVGKRARRAAKERERRAREKRQYQSYVARLAPLKR
jgi:hypothetical protein